MRTLPKIVAVSDIPLAQDAPTDNLIELFRVCTQLERVCQDNHGAGLAAVQVGIPWKLFVVLRDTGYDYFVNCEYDGLGEKKKSIEGCLSLRDEKGLRRFEVDRYPTIWLKGKKLIVTDAGLELQDVNKVVEGFHAIVCQHEIDHHRNLLISDIGKEIEIY